jgi:hypothetical protein
MSASVDYVRAARTRATGSIGAAGPVHAVVRGESAAVCGTESARGWVPVAGAVPTCVLCRKKLGMGAPRPPRAEGGVR